MFRAGAVVIVGGDVGSRPETEHVAERPSWDCVACGKPWPCDPARERIKADMPDPTQQRIYLWLHLEEAAEQLPPMPVAEAIERFLSWA